MQRTPHTIVLQQQREGLPYTVCVQNEVQLCALLHSRVQVRCVDEFLRLGSTGWMPWLNVYSGGNYS